MSPSLLKLIMSASVALFAATSGFAQKRGGDAVIAMIAFKKAKFVMSKGQRTG